jgi:hypothetical protein
MSVVAIRAALEGALNAITPSIATAWENAAFTPPASTIPYQQVWLLLARPSSPEAGSCYFELGYLQVNLKYPRLTGSAAAAARADLIRSTFKQGNSFTSSGQVVNITDTPEVSQGVDDGLTFTIPVKIRFKAFVT